MATPTLDRTIRFPAEQHHPGVRVSVGVPAVPVGARSTVLEIGGVSVLDLIQSSELDLVVGEPAQLFGFPESDPDGVRDRLNEHLVGFSDARAVCGPAEMNGLLTP